MTSSQHSRWFTGRTRLVTVISFVAVGLAGAAAVSANIGILDATSGSNVGNASATGDLVTPSTQVIDVYLPSDASGAPATSTGVQEFTVDAAGTVTVATTNAGLRLDSVAPNAGWTWSLTQTSQTELMVTMTDGTRTLEFVAATTADGNIAASVNELIITPETIADDDDDEQYEDDDDDEYEGGEDDD